jgi:hypothetical protein
MLGEQKRRSLSTKTEGESQDFAWEICYLGVYTVGILLHSSSIIRHCITISKKEAEKKKRHVLQTLGELL